MMPESGRIRLVRPSAVIRVRQLFVFPKNWVSKSSTMSFFHYERLIVDLLMRKLRYERPVLLTGKAFSGYRQKYRSLIVASTMSQALRSFAWAPGDPKKMDPKFGGS